MDDMHEINSELGFWGFYPEAGKHLPFWRPNGALIRSTIEDFWKREHQKQGYQLVYTPHIASADVWETSGHTTRFAEKMYPRMRLENDEEYILRPMNCPFHIFIFKADQHSYKELPLRYAELGTVYRKIPSGSFREMLEVRGFTQDDAHIFCERQKAEEEIANLLEFTVFFLKDVFGIADYRVILRLKPKEAIGEDALWNSAQKLLRDVLASKDIPYEDAPGEGVFYGPKIDFEITDPYYQKEWICSTIQLDIILAEKFDVKYIARDGHAETPLIIHRTILGSLERFIGILLLRTKGHLPLWLSPCQVMLLPLGGIEFSSNLAHAKSVKSLLENQAAGLNLRVAVDLEDRDVREAKEQAIRKKIPYILVIGPRERINQKLSVTHWDGKEYSSTARNLSYEEFTDELRNKIMKRI
ncbi:MAG: threonine--tRNA ligase [Chloroflexi bacterium]|nr:threonine--tRNA ligase [Chloroflexota bacterium]